MVAAQARIGTTLTRLTDEGRSLIDAYESLGRSRAVGRRLVDVPTTRALASTFPEPTTPDVERWVNRG
jgi:hypothetical protein